MQTHPAHPHERAPKETRHTIHLERGLPFLRIYCGTVLGPLTWTNCPSCADCEACLKAYRTDQAA